MGWPALKFKWCNYASWKSIMKDMYVEDNENSNKETN